MENIIRLVLVVIAAVGFIGWYKASRKPAGVSKGTGVAQPTKKEDKDIKEGDLVE